MRWQIWRSDRSDAKNSTVLLEANEYVVGLKRVKADLVETSRVQQMLLDQTKDDAEKLKERRELCTVYIFRIRCYKQRAECMEKTVAEYYNLDDSHTLERATWDKQQQEAKQQLGDRIRDCRKLGDKLQKSTTCHSGFNTMRVIQHGSVEILHYYICFLGRSSPPPHLIQLFRIGTTGPYHAIQDKHHKALMLNILEMILALAFRSLPDELMSRYPTFDIVTLQHSSIHLNVLNPLHRGTLQHDVVRFNARQAFRNSIDWEIRSWPIFRARYQANLPRKDFSPPSDKDYESAFTAAILQSYPSLAEPEDWFNIGVPKEADTSFNLLEQIDGWKKKIQNILGEKSLWRSQSERWRAELLWFSATRT